MPMDSIHKELAELDALIASNPGDAEALYRRGALYWKLGRKAEALSDFTASERIDPAGPGAVAARGVRGIFDFTNPDLYNP